MPPSELGCTSPLLRAEHFDVNNSIERIKCVLVGDGAVGKTSLVVSYSTNGFPNEYIPTAFDNYNVLVRVDGQPISVQLCDTAGQDDFDPLRSLCYPDSDVFLLCFSVVNPTSFQNISEKWLPEIRRFCPEAPLILVGTQSDRRRDARQLQELAQYGQAPVSQTQARYLARRISAATYVETSALTQRDLKEAFDQAIVTALSHRGTILVNTNRNSKLRQKNGKRKQSLWQKLCCFS
ncbi:Rho-related GTP-binding protein RhoU [Cryptotermes secundus]|uniref:Rho-related GTP-binding protein RhoU n=2 Tax=Cryptotermes secundus TaxID=105785 RepID=A0A2J7QJT5_9NEOP|nr:Rho-related GTP-binding protein RhoU [Cryptotermes secundus]